MSENHRPVAHGYIRIFQILLAAPVQSQNHRRRVNVENAIRNQDSEAQIMLLMLEYVQAIHNQKQYYSA